MQEKTETRATLKVRAGRITGLIADGERTSVRLHVADGKGPAWLSAADMRKLAGWLTEKAVRIEMYEADQERHSRGETVRIRERLTAGTPAADRPCPEERTPWDTASTARPPPPTT
ncbi:hypothetical protein [Streptomyces olivoreticuli]|uniref:hypothetical protein n=1 Tax=Streptomyces olivoreticuli TaxID=68246 RepID=UPI000E23615F|nr:hypothetical protein [Streptomyces olivoreticuli]